MKKFVYMFIGGVAALVLVFGGYAAFAQNGIGNPAGNDVAVAAAQVQVQDDSEIDAPADVDTPETEADNADALEQAEEADMPALPGFGNFFGRFAEGFAGRFGAWRDPGMMSPAGDQYLADALGISIEALQTAHETAVAAALQEAVNAGLLTQEQAEQLIESGAGIGRMHLPHFADVDIDFHALLADALGISPDELTSAQQAAHAARLADMVAEGTITQEQADFIAARMALQDYIDYDALNDSFQAIFQEAIDQALADGVITAEQAEAMLNNLPTFSSQNFGGRGFGPHEFGGHHGFGPGRGGHGSFRGFGPGDGTGFGAKSGPSNGDGFGPGAPPADSTDA